MRIGIFSDVHANLEALSAVVEAYGSERIDVYHCLGDTVGYGGSPDECADVVRSVAASTILGNHDAAVSGRMDYSYYYDAARHALDTHAAMLSASNMAWLKALPYEQRLDECDVLLCHGSPVRLEEFEYIFAPEQARECLAIWDRISHITLIGHSHLCKVFALTPDTVEELAPTDFELADDRKYIVSVGSVGQPGISSTWRATPCTTRRPSASSSSALSTTSSWPRRKCCERALSGTSLIGSSSGCEPEKVTYGAHVETPAPTITSGVDATCTMDPSLGRKRVTTEPGLLAGRVNV